MPQVKMLLYLRIWLFLCGAYVMFAGLEWALRHAIHWLRLRSKSGRRQIEMEESVEDARRRDADNVLISDWDRDHPSDPADRVPWRGEMTYPELSPIDGIDTLIVSVDDGTVFRVSPAHFGGPNSKFRPDSYVGPPIQPDRSPDAVRALINDWWTSDVEDQWR